MKNYIELIPEKSLIIANKIVFLLIIVVLIYPFISLGNKKIYNSKEWTVTESARKLANNCQNKNREECYKIGFNKLIKSYNFSFAEQTLYALQDIDEGTKSCHVLAHYLSRTAVKKSPNNWKYLLDNVNVNACGSGFLHGVLEAHIGDNPKTEFSGQLSNEVCNRGDDSYRKRMCTHFMGHFFVVNTLDDVDKALPSCNDVVQELKFDCLNGLFMEHNQKIALEDHGLYPLPNYTPAYAKELENVCLKYKNIEAAACWTEMAEVYAKTFGYNAKTIFDKCYALALNTNDKRSCYFKGVVILATYPYNVTKDKLVDICKFYNKDNEYKSCTTNLISSLLHYSPKYTSRGIDLCSSIKRNNEWCFGELGNQLSTFVPIIEERQSLCASTPENYRRLCINI